MSRLTRRAAASPLATPAAALVRARLGTRHLVRQAREVSRWTFGTREHTNFTFELTPLNVEQLAWWVSAVSGAPVSDTRGYIDEIARDEELREHVDRFTRSSPRWRLADREVRLHKRMGWYALIRATKPEHVVETGTDKGLGTVVMAAAVRRNGHGRVTTIDTNPDSGYLIAGSYASVVDRVVGDSLASLQQLKTPVDLFLHDSLHTPEHETAEFEAVARHLSPRAILLSDYAHESPALAQWAERSGFAYLFFAEQPLRHWLPGEGIGAAFHRPA